MKRKIVTRIHISLDDYLRKYTQALGMKFGTYVSSVLETELRSIGERGQYSFVQDFEYFLPTRNAHERSAGKQFTIYLTDAAYKNFLRVKKITGYTLTTEAVTGILLNTQIGQAYYKQQKSAIAKQKV